MKCKNYTFSSEDSDNGTEENYVNGDENETRESSEVLEFLRGWNWKIKQHGKLFAHVILVVEPLFKLVTRAKSEFIV